MARALTLFEIVFRIWLYLSWFGFDSFWQEEGLSPLAPDLRAKMDETFEAYVLELLSFLFGYDPANLCISPLQSSTNAVDIWSSGQILNYLKLPS